MSNALKCDRCGKLYEAYVGVQLVERGNSYHSFTISGHGRIKSYDLCEECMSSLIDWIKEKEVQNEEA